MATCLAFHSTLHFSSLVGQKFAVVTLPLATDGSRHHPPCQGGLEKDAFEHLREEKLELAINCWNVVDGSGVDVFGPQPT